jgi:c-di-GMP-binding flagellar brake protein YcgR
MPRQSHPERRKYIRLDSVFPVEIYTESRSKEKPRRLIQGFTRDVSLGGLCLSVNDPDQELISHMAIGAEPFEITVNLPLGHTVHARVRVAWHEFRQLARHRQLIAGVSYVEISDAGRQGIVDAARRI